MKQELLNGSLSAGTYDNDHPPMRARQHSKNGVRHRGLAYGEIAPLPAMSLLKAS